MPGDGRARGWEVVEVYADHAISGASMLRPGYQRLLEDVRAGRFDVVLAEGLDRLSRDQEDTAALYKQLSLRSACGWSPWPRARSTSCMSASRAR